MQGDRFAERVVQSGRGEGRGDRGWGREGGREARLHINVPLNTLDCLKGIASQPAT